MGLGNMFVNILITYYIIHLLKMFIKKNRIKIQNKNINLNVLRKIPVKTLEEQKNFLNLKYPKIEKKVKKNIKERMKGWTTITFSISLYILTYNLVKYIIFFEVKIWQAIIFVILFPLLLNLILEKFNIQKSDIKTLIKF